MTDYKDVLAMMRAKRNELQDEVAKLDKAIIAVEALVNTDNSGQVGSVVASTPGISPRVFKNLFMPAAIEKYLTMTQQPQWKKEIQGALIAGGMHHSKSFGAHVYNTLHRLSKADGPFRREPDGRWGLSKWTARSTSASNHDPAKMDWQPQGNVSGR